MSAMLKSAYSWPSTSRSREPAADSMKSGGWSYDVRSQLIGTPLGITARPDDQSSWLRGRRATKLASSRTFSAATRAGSTPDPLTPGSVGHAGSQGRGRQRRLGGVDDASTVLSATADTAGSSASPLTTSEN